MALLGEMIDDGQVLELAFAASNGSGPARRFSINPNYAQYFVPVYRQQRRGKSGITPARVRDLKGNSLQEKFCPARRHSAGGPHAVHHHRWCRQDPLIRAVGIGISGVTDREGAIESLLRSRR